MQPQVLIYLHLNLVTRDNDFHVGGARVRGIVGPTQPMKLSEMLVVNETQTTAIRQKIAGYFAHKYWRQRGIPVPLASNHPFFSNPPTGDVFFWY